jgi:small subunit ribosomal protein S11
MSEEVKKEVAPEEVKEVEKAPVLEVGSQEEKEEKEVDTFSFDSSDEELPEEIKQKLEKNKQARAKKKLVKKKKKKVAKVVKVGRAYIQATYNNTMITLTDGSGDVISWASAGLAGFKGAKKATPYAAQIITKIAVQKAKEEYGLQEVSVFVSGVGTGREAAIRALNANGLEVNAIKDTTPVPHNGCRPKKPRRV